MTTTIFDNVLEVLHDAIDRLNEAQKGITRTLEELEETHASCKDTLCDIENSMAAARRMMHSVHGRSKTMRARLRTMADAIYARILGTGDGVRTHRGTLLTEVATAISYFSNDTIPMKHRSRTFQTFCELAEQLLVDSTHAEVTQKLQILRKFRAGPYVRPVAPHLANLPPPRKDYLEAIDACFERGSPEHDAFLAFFPVLVFPEDIVVESFDL